MLTGYLFDKLSFLCLVISFQLFQIISCQLYFLISFFLINSASITCLKFIYFKLARPSLLIPYAPSSSFKRVFWSASSSFLFSFCTRNVLTQYIRSSSHPSCFDRLGRSLRCDTYDLLSVQSTFLLFLTYSWLITTFWFRKHSNSASSISSSNSYTRILLCLPFHCVPSAILAMHLSRRLPSWFFYFTSLLLSFRFPPFNPWFLLLLSHSSPLFDPVRRFSDLD